MFNLKGAQVRTNSEVILPQNAKIDIRSRAIEFTLDCEGERQSVQYTVTDDAHGEAINKAVCDFIRYQRYSVYGDCVAKHREFLNNIVSSLESYQKRILEIEADLKEVEAAKTTSV